MVSSVTSVTEDVGEEEPEGELDRAEVDEVLIAADSGVDGEPVLSEPKVDEKGIVETSLEGDDDRTTGDPEESMSTSLDRLV